MAITRLRSREIPPTAGLPPRWREVMAATVAPSRNGEFAKRLARFLDVESVQLECSGTASLIVALTSMHRLSGRRIVVVPAYTCPLVALAIAHCGLELRLCDLATDSINFDAAQLARVCDRNTLAVLPTHLAGRVADVDATLAIARTMGAFVIEDAAQALGARRSGKAVGLAGDAGFFSLAVGKGLTTFEGGVLVARDDALRRALAQTSREIVSKQIGWEFKRMLQLLGYHALYRPSLLGLAYGAPLRRALRRGDPVGAVGDDFGPTIPLHTLGAWRQSVGVRALARLPDYLADASARALLRKRRLASIVGITVIDDPADANGMWPFLLLRMTSQFARDAALRALWTAGLGVSRLYIHALPDYDYLASIGAADDIPNARDFAATTLTISNSPGLGDEDFEAICTVLESPPSETPV